MVRRRHVFYIVGYDPQGVTGYYRLFRREHARFAKVWSVATTMGEAEIDADAIAARWHVETAGPNWQVSTTYELLRWDDLIAADMAQPVWRRFARGMACFLDNLVNGPIVRMLVANWRFGLFYLFPTVMLMLAAAAPVVLGSLAGSLTYGLTGRSLAAAILVSIIVAGACYAVILKIVHLGHILHLNDAWLWANDWLHGRRRDFDDRLDIFARRILACVRNPDLDEVLIVGHSGGSAVCVPVVARMLAIDPDFARSGPSVAILDLGTFLPVPACHPRAHALREAILCVATEPSVLWVEAQARKDIMNLYGCDPVQWVGVDAGDDRCNPLMWPVRFRDMLAPEFYARRRWNFFRMHYQFIMANDRRAAYDYFMFVCGPAPFADWAHRGGEVEARFAADARYTAERPAL